MVIAYPLDLFISDNLKNSHDDLGEIEVWNDIYQSKADCEIAIYGSSRAAVHINSKILGDSLNKSVYNFGMNGGPFVLQYLRHLEFLKYNAKPKQIILSVDDYTLVYKSAALYNPEQFLPYLLANSDMQKFASTTDYADNGYTKFDCYLPLVRYTGKSESLFRSVENMFSPHTRQRRERGFYALDKEWNDRFSQKIKYQIAFIPKTVELFEKFINECKNLNIDLILVFTPEYIESQEVVSNRHEIIDLYKNFASKYNLIFLDYSSDELSFSKEFFADSFHLNKKGADIFTAKLAAKLKELGY